jgi:hypothetical protein
LKPDFLSLIQPWPLGRRDDAQDKWSGQSYALATETNMLLAVILALLLVLFSFS